MATQEVKDLTARLEALEARVAALEVVRAPKGPQADAPSRRSSTTTIPQAGG